ncbi:hypothetical protein KY334_05310 [Candidatus Woesearchaeota archaeon]|nr:hypothetical protein [Candidatus Woesearchaeota archaeon]
MVVEERRFIPHLIQRMIERNDVKKVDKESKEEKNLLDDLRKAIDDRDLAKIKKILSRLGELLTEHATYLSTLIKYQNIEIQDYIDHLVTLKSEISKLESMGLKNDPDIQRHEKMVLGHVDYFHKKLKHRQLMSEHYLTTLNKAA